MGCASRADSRYTSGQIGNLAKACPTVPPRRSEVWSRLCKGLHPRRSRVAVELDAGCPISLASMTVDAKIVPLILTLTFARLLLTLTSSDVQSSQGASHLIGVTGC